MRIKCRMVMVLLVVGMVSVASAAPTFYEGFDYTMGTENLRGQGPWVSPGVSPHEDFDVYAGSLSYIDGFNNTLVTSGNSSGRKSKDPGVGNNRSDVETTLNASTQALFTSTQTIYMSFLLGNGPGGILLRDNINLDGSLLIDGTNDSAGGSMRLRGTGGAGGSGEFGTQLPYGAPARFYVMKIDNVAGGADTVSIIFDPADITTEPSFSFPDITLTFDIKTPDTLFLNAWPDNANYGGGGPMSSTGPHIDEIRIGTSWADVAPDGPPQPDPTDFTWAKNDLGSWTDTSNWDPYTVPNNANHTATFGSAATGTTAAVVHSAVTVNRVTFDNTHQYIVGGGGSVNLAATTEGPPVNPAIDVISSNHQFQAIVNLLDDTTVNVASGSTLSFNNELSLLGNTLTKTGAGTLAINNRLTTAGGTVILQEGTISGGGTIGGNVNNNDGTISPGDNLLGAQTVVPELGAQTVVPEPTAALLLGLGLLWVFGLSRSTSRQ